MKKHQILFDHKTFFAKYKALRASANNYNDLLEQPAMAKLLPDVSEKAVLDLGCGYGKNCLDFIKKGACRVTGVDISEKMLEIAKAEAADSKIEYLRMDMADIKLLNQKFDIIYSSLAFHYAEDFRALAADIFSLLNQGGCLLFSQEHPLITATYGGRHHYNKDKNGRYSTFTFSNYGQPGRRNIFWYVKDVEKYHRRFSDIMAALIDAGFLIDAVCEPLPDDSAAEKLPEMLEKERIKPTFLIVRARKP